METKIDIRSTIPHMSKESLIEILLKIYDEYPTIRHSFYEGYKKAIKEVSK